MRSWVEGAFGSGFDLDNLPIGIFRTDDTPRPGVAIGNHVVDLSLLIRAHALDEETLLDAKTLNAFLARGRERWRALRAALQRVLAVGAADDIVTLVRRALVPRSSATMEMPIDVADYVDFYSNIEHATNGGRILRPGADPLPRNYRHLPIGYHGRAGTVVVSGTPIRRPQGQSTAEAGAPTFGPSRRLDIELELGFIAGPPTELGCPVPIDRACDHLYGLVLLNDWSARDIQAWEYQPLGPFLGKSFATSISPWIVSLDALEPARVQRRVQEPPPLPHLRDAPNDAYDIELEIWLQSQRMVEGGLPALRVARVNFCNMYWSLPQQLAHATSNGASVRSGDLFGSGTISGENPGSYGSLLELTWAGERPLTLPTGEQRSFLEDGDTVTMRGLARGKGHRLSFGTLTGTIAPTLSP